MGDNYGWSDVLVSVLFPHRHDECCSGFSIAGDQSHCCDVLLLSIWKILPSKHLLHLREEKPLLSADPETWILCSSGYLSIIHIVLAEAVSLLASEVHFLKAFVFFRGRGWRQEEVIGRLQCWTWSNIVCGDGGAAPTRGYQIVR